MRKKAGSIFMTLLLLIVPALANAWTLTVKVAGGTAAQPVTVAYQTSGDVQSSKTLKVGTNYLYPKAGITLAAAGTPTYQINGATATIAEVNALTSGPKTVTVTYTPAAVLYNGLSLTQVPGGQIFAQNLNNTWSNSSVAGYVQGALVPVTIAADANHKITGYSVGGVHTDAAGKVFSFNVAANGQAVVPEFAVDAKISATLFAPTNAVAGKAVTLTVTATSNDTGLLYSFSKDNGASFSTPAAQASYTFTPAEGTVKVVAKVSSANLGTFTTPTATILVANAVADGNSQCVSCHNTQPAVHTYSAVQTACTVCHSTMPHNAGSVAIHVDEANCSSCHAASVTAVQASIHYTKPSEKLACSSCHAQGPNPEFIAEACVGCHGVINDHTEAAIGTKTCIACHDKHNPTTITGTLGPQSAHPAVTLYTFEEVGMQMAGGQPVPVQVDAKGNGMPYSPKQTCGTSGCHVKNGVDYTYDKISDHAFHSNQGRSEYTDSGDGKFDATKNKPWTQSTAMVGKW